MSLTYKRLSKRPLTLLRLSGVTLSEFVKICHRGKHDFRIRKEEKPLPRDAEKYVDLGYQGLQKRTPHVLLPFRRKKQQSLTREQKNHNQRQASFRMKVEHKIRELNVFKSLSETYRNFSKKQHLRFNSMAGIVNLRHGF